MIESLNNGFSVFLHSLGVRELIFYSGALVIPAMLHGISANYFIRIDHARVSPLANRQPSINRRSVPWYLDSKKVSNELRQRWYYFASVHILLTTASFLMLVGVYLADKPKISFYQFSMPALWMDEQWKVEFVAFIVFSLAILYIFKATMQSYAKTNTHRGTEVERRSFYASAGTLILPILWHFLFRLNWISI